MRKFFALIFTLAIFGTALYWLLTRPMTIDEPSANVPTESSLDANNPVSVFSRRGTVTFDNPGLKKGVPYLVYEEPGAPALSTELVLSDNTICAMPTGEQACVVYDSSLDALYGGKQAEIVGSQRADGAVLVKKITRLE